MVAPWRGTHELVISKEGSVHPDEVSQGSVPDLEQRQPRYGFCTGGDIQQEITRTL